MSVDPVDVGANVGVDAGVLGLATGDHSPGDDAGKDVLIAAFNGAGQWAARVTRAYAFSTA